MSFIWFGQSRPPRSKVSAVFSNASKREFWLSFDRPLRTGEDVEPGTAARPRVNRRVSDNQRRAWSDQLTSIREERRIDGHAVGKFFEVRPAPADTRN